MTQFLVQRISEVLAHYPGRDPVALYITQSDGRVFKACLPATTNTKAAGLRAEINDLVGNGCCDVKVA